MAVQVTLLLCMTSCLPESAARRVEGGKMVEEEHDMSEQPSKGMNNLPCIIYHKLRYFRAHHTTCTQV